MGRMIFYNWCKYKGEKDGSKIYRMFFRNNFYINMHSFVIICYARDNNGEERTFKSENIWLNPERIIERNHIDILPVYIDPKNPKKYYVSIEKIENYRKK